MITERQVEILNKIIQDYIDFAQPISSEFLEKKHNFGISPATIRIEMQKLTDLNFLYQPHTSAGRIPTDKAYRFYVNRLLKTGGIEKSLQSPSLIRANKRMDEIIKNLSKESKEEFLKFSQEITKFLAFFSSNFVLSYLCDEEIFWKEGWQEIFEEPEFQNANSVKNFFETIEEFEKDIEDFIPENSQTQIYIGGENQIPQAKEFSIISARYCFPNKEEGILSILGPKRMTYARNIGIMNSLKKLLKEI